MLADVFTDQGVSGGAALDKRPGLLAALAALKQYNASILLVARRDRLARDVLVAAFVERLVERDGATVQSADGTADGAGPEAVLMRRILDAFAEYERLIIRARTRAALALKRSRGERTGPSSPRHVAPIGDALAPADHRKRCGGGAACPIVRRKSSTMAGPA